MNYHESFQVQYPIKFFEATTETMFYGYILPGKEAQQSGRGSK